MIISAIAVLIVLFVVLLYVLLYFHFVRTQQKEWNKGICPKCRNGCFEYEYRYFNKKWYSCENCDNRVLIVFSIDNDFREDAREMKNIIIIIKEY